ncbi:AlbA family DNA-binding domain-containing protein [Pseudomonas sp. GM102]|uniref:AlbA family DNA-binding domain-containing protein n=1 Tax=Pseudomonas sp. GM102 TaxID=1144321 RepID=UPI00031D9DCC|nr:ATP-binding protein [Pseudomonas sp. GM102]
MIELLNTLRYKSEGPDIDFKSAQYRFNGASELDKSEMLKDILAIANSWRDSTGYILLGFKDQRPHPAEVVGIRESIDDAQIQQFINGKVKPKLTFRYEEHLYEGKTVGVITIPKQKRPFYLANAYGKIKSNVVYVRRGSSTDEAEPTEIAAMVNDDSGRGDIRLDLSLIAPNNEALPSTFARTYLEFTEEFPDFKKARKPSNPFEFQAYSNMERDNSDFWREYAEYIKLDEALIAVQFLLLNQSGVQLTNAKLEVVIDALDDQRFQLLEASEVPTKPKPQWNFVDRLTTAPHVLTSQNSSLLVIDENESKPIVHVRFGSLLPGEQGRSETLAIVPQGIGRLRLRLRILGSEIATPIEEEHLLETTGEAQSLDFEGFRQFVQRKLAVSKGRTTE